MNFQHIQNNVDININLVETIEFKIQEHPTLCSDNRWEILDSIPVEIKSVLSIEKIDEEVTKINKMYKDKSFTNKALITFCVLFLLAILLLIIGPASGETFVLYIGVVFFGLTLICFGIYYGWKWHGQGVAKKDIKKYVEHTLCGKYSHLHWEIRTRQHNDWTMIDIVCKLTHLPTK
eukprot:281310_1